MTGAVVAELMEVSGLSAGQVGRLFGTSSRRVHDWVQGTVAVDEAARNRAEHLLQAVTPLAGSPEARRAALLDSSAGASPFRRLLDQVPRHQRLHYPALTAAQQLGSE